MQKLWLGFTSLILSLSPSPLFPSLSFSLSDEAVATKDKFISFPARIGIINEDVLQTHLAARKALQAIAQDKKQDLLHNQFFFLFANSAKTCFD